MNRLTGLFGVFVACLILISAAAALAAPNATQPANPAKVVISVSPETVAPGGQAEVTVKLTPSAGIKINRYPKIKLSVPTQEGRVAEVEAEVGNESPPPLDDPESNYFDVVDPVTLTLDLDDSISSGAHEIEGKLTYFYCVKKSGFCAPKRATVKIALNVR
jgi:spermidine/putrescine-binding protein